MTDIFWIKIQVLFNFLLKFFFISKKENGSLSQAMSQMPYLKICLLFWYIFDFFSILCIILINYFHFLVLAIHRNTTWFLLWLLLIRFLIPPYLTFILSVITYTSLFLIFDNLMSWCSRIGLIPSFLSFFFLLISLRVDLLLWLTRFLLLILLWNLYGKIASS